MVFIYEPCSWFSTLPKQLQSPRYYGILWIIKYGDLRNSDIFFFKINYPRFPDWDESLGYHAFRLCRVAAWRIHSPHKPSTTLKTLMHLLAIISCLPLFIHILQHTTLVPWSFVLIRRLWDTQRKSPWEHHLNVIYHHATCKTTTTTQGAILYGCSTKRIVVNKLWILSV